MSGMGQLGEALAHVAAYTNRGADANRVTTPAFVASQQQRWSELALPQAGPALDRFFELKAKAALSTAEVKELTELGRSLEELKLVDHAGNLQRMEVVGAEGKVVSTADNSGYSPAKKKQVDLTGGPGPIDRAQEWVDRATLATGVASLGASATGFGLPAGAAVHVVSSVADLLNAAVDGAQSAAAVARGDRGEAIRQAKDAGLRALGAVPLAGEALKAAKLGIKVGDAGLEAAKVVGEAASEAEKVADVAKTTGDVGEVAKTTAAEGGEALKASGEAARAEAGAAAELGEAGRGASDGVGGVVARVDIDVRKDPLALPTPSRWQRGSLVDYKPQQLRGLDDLLGNRCDLGTQVYQAFAGVPRTVVDTLNKIGASKIDQRVVLKPADLTAHRKNVEYAVTKLETLAARDPAVGAEMIGALREIARRMKVMEDTMPARIEFGRANDLRPEPLARLGD